MSAAPSVRRLRGYVDEALREIRSTAVFSSRVAWDEVDREAQSVLVDAVAYVDTHPFLAGVLTQAGGGHSHLTPPPGSVASRPPSARMAAALGPQVPTGHLMDQGAAAVGYLGLPRLPEGMKSTRGYLAEGTAVMRALIAARPGGWIVDLRANVGGGMWPMLAVAAPLLPGGVLGNFVRPGGSVEAWTSRRGRVALGARTMARTRIRRLPEDGSRIAVLTSRHTASAGEAVALAFRGQPRARLIGSPTAGMTTGNRTHVLPDGTRLHISSAFYADRDGTVVEGPIAVDEHLADDSREAALAAALSWLG